MPKGSTLVREARSLGTGRHQIPLFDGISVECDAAASGETSCSTESLTCIDLPEFATLHSANLPQSILCLLCTLNGTLVAVCVNIQDSVLQLQLGTVDLDMGILDFSKDLFGVFFYDLFGPGPT